MGRGPRDERKWEREERKGKNKNIKLRYVYVSVSLDDCMHYVTQIFTDKRRLSRSAKSQALSHRLKFLLKGFKVIKHFN